MKDIINLKKSKVPKVTNLPKHQVRPENLPKKPPVEVENLSKS